MAGRMTAATRDNTISERLDRAISEVLAARLAEKKIDPRDIMGEVRLTSRDLNELILFLTTYHPPAILDILVALSEAGDAALEITLSVYRDMTHKLLLWVISDILLPSIQVGEGVGRARPLAGYVYRKMVSEDIGYDEWRTLASQLNEAILRSKDTRSRSVLQRLREIVQLKADRKRPADQITAQLQHIRYWVDRNAIPKVVAKLCDLIREQGIPADPDILTA